VLGWNWRCRRGNRWSIRFIRSRWNGRQENTWSEEGGEVVVVSQWQERQGEERVGPVDGKA